MRYIKLPLLFEDEEGQIYSTEINLNPFTIESYYSSSYFDEQDKTIAKDITIINCKSGISYDVMLSIQSFEKIHARFMAQ
jgi:hypothetical protein